MADKKIISIEIKVSEGNAKKAINETAAATEKLSSKVTLLTKSQKEQIIADEKSAIQKRALIASLKAEAAAQMNAAAATNNAKATSGLNNAILLETSRLASDASYGFTAIANNLGQLVNLFQISASNAGGFIATLKQLGRSLLGSGGVLIAIQLLIAFGDDIYNFFFNSTKAADEFEKKIKDLTSSIDETLSKIVSIRGDFLDFERTSEDLADTVLILEKNFSDFRAGLENLKEKGLDKNDEALRNLTKSYFELNTIQKSIIAIQTRLQQQDEKGVLFSEERNRLQEELRRLLLRQIELEELFTNKSNKGSEKRIRQFKRGFLDLARLEERYRQESIYQETLTEQQKIDLKYDNAKEEAQILLNQFMYEEAIRLRRFLKDSQNNEAKKRAIKEYNESILKAEKDFNDLLIQIDSARQNKTLESLDKQQQKALDIRQKINQKEIDILKYGLDANQEFYDENAKQINRDIKLREFSLKYLILEQDEKAKLEMELFDLRENLRQNDLRSEQDVIKEKQRINQEYASFAQGIGQLFKTLANENEEMQKAALIVEKGAAIADVIIRTQAANQQIRAGYAATAAIKSIDPTALARFSALATAQIARNNVGAGISVANILATTLTSFRKPTGAEGGGGRGVEVEAPDFNVVGASPESQLAQTVAAQEQKPLRAFVVGRDITNQQELERNIKTNAGLGD